MHRVVLPAELHGQTHRSQHSPSTAQPSRAQSNSAQRPTYGLTAAALLQSPLGSPRCHHTCTAQHSTGGEQHTTAHIGAHRSTACVHYFQFGRKTVGRSHTGQLRPTEQTCSHFVHSCRTSTGCGGRAGVGRMSQTLNTAGWDTSRFRHLRECVAQLLVWLCAVSSCCC